MDGRDCLQAEIDALRNERESLQKAITAKDEKMEVALAKMAELERLVQNYKGQIEAYQYCLNCRR